ncbi:major facilitator superfamily domain-containing protein [Exophiala viscosa]|uniref:major facilitator superfamily domain-containing protein n=1 Tax=Exophiala viscosa TaxID=2486360 RepID=UPI00218E661E|nr:major facilitator superfamily domain-containing protein [Exophiala viscosa]
MYGHMEDVVFDPKIHLAYDGKVQRITMEELKLPRTSTSSPVAGSLPFKLLSGEGVLAYRKALFDPKVIDQCAVSPRPGTLVLRGAGKISKFVHDFWTHEETMKIISDIVDVPLSIIMKGEIAHTNIQAKGSNLEEMKASLRPEPSLGKVKLTEEEKNYKPLDENSIIPWHHDSYPYVCVLMISETEGMLGGETYIKAGDGEISKVEGPMMGYGCVLQGGEVEHLAARAFGVAERITTITSYRPNVTKAYDSSYISNLRAYSGLGVLYQEWALYRLDKMKEEIEALHHKIQSSGAVDTGEFDIFGQQQTEYLLRSTTQMVPVDFHNRIIAKYVTFEPLPDPIKVEGGLIVDTENLASTEGLKLSRDGHTVLIPQPTDSEADCLNWSTTKKHLILFTIAWDALCADFVGAIGSAPIIFQAAEWQMSFNKANQPNAITVLLLGISGLIWVPMSSYWDRAPVLFWTEVIGFFFTVGTALCNTYETFFAMRVLSAIFLTASQTVSLALLKDIFFFHERARKIGLWAALYTASPYLGPQLGSFVVGKTLDWHNVYWMAAGCVAIQLLLLVLFLDETWYNRTLHSHEQPHRSQTTFGRLGRLTGAWQIQHHKRYFSTVSATYRELLFVILQPHFTLIAILYFLVFMWAVGINVTTGVVFATPASYGGYGYNTIQLGCLYFSPNISRESVCYMNPRRTNVLGLPDRSGRVATFFTEGKYVS